MKLIFVFLSIILATSAFANDSQALSNLISKNYQTMIDELPAGNYNSKVSVVYLVPLGNGEDSVTTPVLFVPNIEINIPFKMEDCSENTQSIACNIAVGAFKWYEMNQPATSGSFQVELQVGVEVKKLIFPINHD